MLAFSEERLEMFIGRLSILFFSLAAAVLGNVEDVVNDINEINGIVEDISTKVEQASDASLAKGFLMHYRGCSNYNSIKLTGYNAKNTLAQCKQKCEDENECREFSYGVKSHNRGFCLLMKSGCIEDNNRDWETYKVVNGVSATQLKHNGGCSNYNSIKLARHETTHTVKECSRKCEQVNECREFNFGAASSNRGFCLLMKAGCVADSTASWKTYKINVAELKHNGGCSNFGSIELAKHEWHHTVAQCSSVCEETIGCLEFNIGVTSGFCLLTKAGCVNDNIAAWKTYKMMTGAVLKKDKGCYQGHRVGLTKYQSKHTVAQCSRKCEEAIRCREFDIGVGSSNEGWCWLLRAGCMAYQVQDWATYQLENGAELKHNGGCSNYNSIKLTRHQSKHSVAECSAKCQQKSGCLEFNLGTRSHNRGWCLLTKAGCTDDNNAAWDTYMISGGLCGHLRNGGCTQFTSEQLPNGRVGNGYRVDTCRAKCKSTTLCGVFVFAQADGFCHLYKQRASRVCTSGPGEQNVYSMYAVNACTGVRYQRKRVLTACETRFRIHTAAECEEAAKWLRLTDTTPDIMDNGFYPAGCYFQGYNYLVFNRNSLGSVVYQSQPICKV